MSYFFKRDITTNNAPADNQISVGELVFNAKTGILYGKRTDGKVVKFMSAAIDDTSPGTSLLTFTPIIKFSDVTNFCCNGDTITVTVNNLLANNQYSYAIVDTIANSSTYISSVAGSLSPIDSSRREVSLNIGVSSLQNNALLKFSVIKNGVVLAENILPICCSNCT